jgi:hypothetical protein
VVRDTDANEVEFDECMEARGRDETADAPPGDHRYPLAVGMMLKTGATRRPETMVLEMSAKAARTHSITIEQ